MQTEENLGQQNLTPEVQEEIQNPAAVLAALNAAKEQKARERERNAQLEQQLKEMQAQVEAHQKEAAEYQGVLQQVMKTMGGEARPGDPAKGVTALLQDFDAKRRMEELQRQFRQEGEQAALSRINPELEELKAAKEQAAREALELRQQIKFSRLFEQADGLLSELNGFWRAYGLHFHWSDEAQDFTEFRDANGNTVLDANGSPLSPSKALMAMRQGKLEGFGNMAKSVFAPFNQSQGGGTPVISRRAGGRTIPVYKNMQEAITKNMGVAPTELARRLRDGEIAIGE